MTTRPRFALLFALSSSLLAACSSPNAPSPDVAAAGDDASTSASSDGSAADDGRDRAVTNTDDGGDGGTGTGDAASSGAGDGGCAVCSGKGTWTTLSRMPTARSYPAAALGSDGRIYVIGGGAGAPLAVVEAYSPATDSWTRMTDAPTARWQAAATVGADGNIYVAGGCLDQPCTTRTAAVEVYDAATDSWSDAADLPSAVSGASAATSSNGTLYVAGGYTNAGAVNDVFAYTLSTNRWVSAPALATARGDLGVATVGNVVFAFGGWTGSPSAAAESLVTGAGAWTALTSMPVALSGVTAAAASSKVYVAGGYDGTEKVGSLSVYDPTTDSWTRLANMATSRDTARMVRGNDGRLYVFGGLTTSNNVPSDDAEAYTP